MIILYGIKHCGKSTIGSLLASKLNVSFIDLDKIIEQIANKSCRELYIQDGKEEFIKREILATTQIAENHSLQNAVIATGGGICDNSKALSILSNESKSFFIQIDESTAFERIQESSATLGSWPAWIPKELYNDIGSIKNVFHNFYTERTQKYSQICNYQVFVENGDSKKATDTILKMLDFPINQ